METGLPSQLSDGGRAAPHMRITGVRVHHLSARLKERFGWSLNWHDQRQATVVEVATDAGLTGWGEGPCAAGLIAQRPELVIGRSPFEVEAIYDELREPPGHQRRPGAPSSAGLDVALWDLAGKALGLPVSHLLGRRYRDRVAAYCTALYRQDWPDLAEGLANEARCWAARGFRAMKMKIGYSAETDARIVRAVREAIGGSVGLAVDSNCAYDAGTAIRLGGRLEELDLMWWEEPLLAADLAGYTRLKSAIRIPLAGGETESLDWLIANYIQPRLLDIIQPDVVNVGLTGARSLSRLCWLAGLRLLPHNWGTAIRTAATLHWMSCCPPLTPALNPPEVMLEFDQSENPLRDAVVAQPIRFDPADGRVAVPAAPGLGITVVREAIEEYRTELATIGG
jgi:D-galactarolactone cycloisomerase